MIYRHDRFSTSFYGGPLIVIQPAHGRAWFFCGVFLTCMCGLMLQIMQTRILSITSYYHMAFFAIGMGMLGMTAGALLVYYNRVPLGRSLGETMSNIMVVFGAVTLLSLVLLLTSALTSRFEPTLRFALVWAWAIAVLLPPYVLLGMAISLALTRSPYPVSQVYGVDLLGAAIGCLATLFLLSITDTFTAVIVVAAVGAAAAWFFLRAGLTADTAPNTSPTRFRLRPIPTLSVLLLLALANHSLGTRGLRPILIKGYVENTHQLSEERWNSFSRIAMYFSPKSPAFLWSASRVTPKTEIEQGWLNIDGDAGTPIYRFSGDRSEIEFLRYDATALAYSIRNRGRSAVIGIGGGRDLLTASLFGFRDITGVEYNPIFVDLFANEYADFSGAKHIEGLRLVVDDARSWFARATDRFDLIQMSLIDTWAATGAGAFTLSENGLYTVEGWKRFLDRLTPTGVFTVSRWFSPEDLDETGRVLSLAMATLLEMGVNDPARHLFLASNERLSTLIIGKAALSEQDVSTLLATVDRLQYSALVVPGREPRHPTFARILRAKSTDELVRFGRENKLDLSPTWDRNPFFFNQIRLTDPFALVRAATRASVVAKGNATATLTLLTLVALSMLVVIAVVLVPAAKFVAQGERTTVVRGSLYFLLIGFGFMFVEIGLIQRMSLFLGHPVYGLAVVLFGIILSTGLGSFASERLVPLKRLPLFGWPLALAAYLVFVPLWLPVLMNTFETAGLIERVGVCLLGIVPCGVLMGLMFPTGMRLIGRLDERPTPWFWAVNGAAGVLASGAAVLLSIQTSLDHTLWFGALCYGLLALVAPSLARLPTRAHPLSDELALPIAALRDAN